MDEKLIVRLVGDVKQYLDAMKASEAATRRAAAEVKESAQKVEQLQGVLNNAAGSVRGFTSSLLAMVGIGGALEVFKRSISLSAEAESMQIDFATMLQSGEKASKLMKDIKRLAADTPLETAGLVKVTRGLLQNQVGEGDMVETLRRLGDIAGGSQEKLQGLAYAFGQVKSMNRLMGEEKNQLLNWGFNPIQEMARTSGKSTAQLLDDMEQGKIGFKELEAAVISATSKGGQFFDGMKNQSKGLIGLYSTLKDETAGLLRTTGDMLVEELKLKEAVKDMTAAFSAAAEYVKNLDKDMVSSAVTAAKWLAGAVALAGGIRLLTMGYAGLLAVLGPLRTAYAMAYEAAYAKAAMVGPVTAGMTRMTMAATALKAAVGVGLVYGFAEVAKAAVNSSKAMEDFNNEQTRAQVLAGAMGGTADRRAKKFLDYTQQLAGDSGDPMTMKTLVEEQLKQSEMELDQANKAVESAKKRYADNAGMGKQATSSVLNTFGLGQNLAAEIELEKNLVATSEAGAKAAAARVQTFKEALKEFDPKKMTADMDKSIADITRGLKEFTAQIGLTGAEAELAKLKVKGYMTPEGYSNARGLLRMREEAEKSEKLRLAVADLNKDMEWQARVYGMTSDEARLYKLAVDGATESQLANARGLMNMNRGLDEQKALQEAAARTKEQFGDPVERYAKGLGELEKQMNAGLISSGEYGRAAASMADQIGRAGAEAKQARQEVQRFDAALATSAAGRRVVSDYVRSLDRRRLDNRDMATLNPARDNSFAAEVGRVTKPFTDPKGPDERIPALLTRIAKAIEAQDKREKQLKAAAFGAVVGGLGLGAPV